MLVLSCPVGRGHSGRGHCHEPGLVVGMVLHVGGQDVQSVELGGERGANAAVPARRSSPTSRAASAVELVGDDLDTGEVGSAR